MCYSTRVCKCKKTRVPNSEVITQASTRVFNKRNEVSTKITEVTILRA